jgi:hypothetical protein
LLSALTQLDPEAGALLRDYFAATDGDGKRKVAERIADRVLGTRGFFEWDSTPEAQPEPEAGEP